MNTDQQGKNYPSAGRILGAAIGGANSCAASPISHLGCEAGSQRPARTLAMELEIQAEKSFPNALEAAASGHRITRAGWNAGGQWVAAQFPDDGSKMGQPYLYLKNAQGNLVPWVPSQGDLFANDWAVIPIQPLY